MSGWPALGGFTSLRFEIAMLILYCVEPASEHWPSGHLHAKAYESY